MCGVSHLRLAWQIKLTARQCVNVDHGGEVGPLLSSVGCILEDITPRVGDALVLSGRYRSQCEYARPPGPLVRVHD